MNIKRQAKRWVKTHLAHMNSCKMPRKKKKAQNRGWFLFAYNMMEGSSWSELTKGITNPLDEQYKYLEL